MERYAPYSPTRIYAIPRTIGSGSVPRVSFEKNILSGNYIKDNYIFALNQIETIDILQNDTIYQIFSIYSEDA
ncbi:hypothetical protein JHK84_040219 [Glycine max]|nr:hypothetical protein JHK84_040219 [Glycine max]